MQPDIPAWTEQQAPMQTHIEQQPTETEPETTTTATPTPSAPVTLRRSTRERQPPSYLGGFDTTQKRSYTRKDNTDNNSHETASMALIDAPATYEEAMSSEYAENWKQAMQEEMQSLIANNTWELKTAPSGTNIIPTKWVYAIKRDANGDITRFKARLVAKGFKQKEGIDFDEVFAPVSKHSTLRALLAKVAADNLELRQLDVTTAFLQGDINEEVFVQQPQGFEQGKGLTCHLNRALYGLRQAPRAWYQRLHSELDSIGFKESSADPSLYIKIYKTHIVYVLVYVDDILIAGNKEAVDYVSACLSSAFKVRDLGDVHLFLGMTITRDRKNRMLMLGQERMITSLLTKYGQESARPNATPLNSSITLCRTEGEPLDTDKYPYSNVIGSLMYLSVCTRPDISQAVGALARYMTAPTTVHWKAAISVLRYLAGTADYGIMFGNSTDNLKINGYCDADFAGDIDTRRSTTGYIFTLNGGAISWSSRRQQTVAVSTAEAEYMAAAYAVKEALWLRKLAADLQLDTATTVIYGDNQAAIKLLKNPISSLRSKHIDVIYHFAREHLISKEIEFVYISTDVMIADVLTKAVPKAKHLICMKGMGMHKLI